MLPRYLRCWCFVYDPSICCSISISRYISHGAKTGVWTQMLQNPQKQRPLALRQWITLQFNDLDTYHERWMHLSCLFFMFLCVSGKLPVLKNVIRYKRLDLSVNKDHQEAVNLVVLMVITAEIVTQNAVLVLTNTVLTVVGHCAGLWCQVPTSSGI